MTAMNQEENLYNKIEKLIVDKQKELDRHIKESKSFLSTYKHNHRGENVNPTANTQEEYEFLMKCKAKKTEFSNVLKKLKEIGPNKFSNEEVLSLKEKYNNFAKLVDKEFNKKTAKKSR